MNSKNRLGRIAAQALLVVAAVTLRPAFAQSLPAGYVQNPEVKLGMAPKMSVEEVPTVTRGYQVRFSPGDEILSGLTDLARAHGIKSAQITGVGGLSSALLAFGDPSMGNYVFKLVRVDEKSELVSLDGSVSERDGEPYVHLHAVVALSDGSTRGGHVLELHVAPVAEITVLVTSPAD